MRKSDPLEVRRAYLMELRYSIPPDVHPAGATTIDHWIVDALAALDNSNLAEVERLEKMIRDKIESERAWSRYKRREKVPLELIEMFFWMAGFKDRHGIKLTRLWPAPPYRGQKCRKLSLGPLGSLTRRSCVVRRQGLRSSSMRRRRRSNDERFRTTIA
jgi:hypothetical protein